MARGINIPFIANVRDFLRGTKSAEDALDDVIDALDDVGREGTDAERTAGRALDGMGDDAKDAARQVDDLTDATKDTDKALDDLGRSRGLSDVQDDAKDAGRAVDRDLADKVDDAGDKASDMERKFRDAFDNVKRDSGTAGQSIGDDITKGSKRAEEGLDEIKESARSNATETAASFDGSFSSISDGVQGTVAEFLQGFGPAGTIAGLAIAGGIGLLSKAMGDQSEQAQQDAQEMADAYKAALDDMIESGENFVSQDLISKSIQDLVSDEKKLDKAHKEAASSGASLTDVLRAQAGDLQSATKVHDAYQAKIDAEQKAFDDAGNRADAYAKAHGRVSVQLADEVQEHGRALLALQDQQKAADKVTDGYKKQTSAADAYRQAVKPTTEQVRAAGQAERDYADDLDDTTSSIKDNNESIKNKSDRERANKTAIDDLVDSGDAWVQSLRDANAASKDVSAAQGKVYKDVVSAGRAMGMSKGEAEDYADSILDIPEKVKTQARLDLNNKSVSDADRKIDSATKDRKVDVTVNPKVDTSQIQRVLNGRVFHATVVARPGSPVAF